MIYFEFSVFPSVCLKIVNPRHYFVKFESLQK